MTRIICVLLLAFASGQSLAQARLYLEASPAVALPGEQVEIKLVAEDLPAVYGVQASLLFDADKIRVIDANEKKHGVQSRDGDVFVSSRLFTLKNEVRHGSAEYIASLVAPDKEVSGSGVVFSMVVDATEAGAVAVSIADARFGTAAGKVVVPEIVKQDDILTIYASKDDMPVVWARWLLPAGLLVLLLVVVVFLLRRRTSGPQSAAPA